MVSPLLDENAILATLALPVNMDNAEILRGGSCWALVNAHDRKVTREFYCEVVNYSYVLNEQLRRAEVMSRILIEVGDALPDEKRTFIKQRIEGAIVAADHARTTLKDMVAKMTECPLDDSIIH